jgi:hypothetical protein
MSAEIAKHELLRVLQGLSAADRSVLAATLETPGSQIATVRGSPNDLLWSKLVELGFAREMVLDLELPPQLKHIQPRSFALTGAGRTALAELLPTLPPP